MYLAITLLYSLDFVAVKLHRKAVEVVVVAEEVGVGLEEGNLKVEYDKCFTVSFKK